MPRPYPPEFRQRALDLVRSGRSVAEAAQLPGIAESCPYRWKNQDLAGRGLKPGTGRAGSAGLAAARRRIRDLEEENKILRKAAAAVEQVVPPKERYRLVAELHADGVRVRQACYSMGVSTSGYCEWKTRAPSAGPVRRAWLTGLTGQVHEASYGTCGQPRVLAGLQRARGVVAGHNTVALLMRRAGVSGLPLRRRAKRVPAQKTVTDLARRNFTADAPNRLRVTGITGHPTREGKLCCCVVIDVFSRRVAGRATGSARRADLAANALGMAAGSRRPSPGAVIHGDHGSQFTSWTFTARARNAGLLPSPGTAGGPYGNAVARSFRGRMQAGLLNRQRRRTRAGLANAVFEYTGGFCNRRRRHSAIGWAAPLEFETKHRQQAATPQDPFQETGA